ncbi:START domain-containing protein 10-like [Homalodisca vitripennis]|uniref:START domain-containing protein 10 n=1 Tax=Homalodisca liturata TaxID=320908 RepID=A0A1B6JJS3_9HEMI|nr:START domain-containing protein 10-like [Homalodisca vitripennis]KAG8303107.1 START domain-containing protein 10 [Homalodisca vitripennis]
MEVGQVKVAEDKDFENLKLLVDNHSGWKLDYSKNNIHVWTKNVSNTNFKMVKVKAVFADINPEQLYDVLHDPEYRKVWDQHMIEAKDIGCLNPNNDVGYYSMSCPKPLGNRDFVLQRSWLDLGNEKYILNHSVYHCQHPPRQGFIRATSYLTGYLVRSYPDIPGCELGYISQTDPQGTLPPWLVNRVTQIFGPKLIKDLQKASLGYLGWKAKHNPHWKPWHYPEQILSPRIKMHECVRSPAELEYKSEADAKLEAALVKHKKSKMKKEKNK